jgi:hypothetical protein
LKPVRPCSSPPNARTVNDAFKEERELEEQRANVTLMVQANMLAHQDASVRSLWKLVRY